MTLPVQVPQIEYAEDGVSTSFPVPFRYRDPAHIRAERVAADGTVTSLVAGTDYSLGAGDTASGGTLTVTVAAAAGVTLVIWRETPLKSDGDYETTGAFKAQSHEDLLDEAAMRDQDQQLQLDRAPKVPRGEGIGALPALAQRKGSLLGAASAIAYAGYDADGNPTVDTPENFAAPAAAEADRAQTEANRAEMNAGFAEEFNQGRSYSTRAAGEAATIEGQFFRVPIGTTPETYTRYQRTSVGSVEAASLATTADLASTDSAKGAALIAKGYTALNELTPITPEEFGVFGADNTGIIRLAVAVAIATGRPLFLNKIYTVSTFDHALDDGINCAIPLDGSITIEGPGTIHSTVSTVSSAVFGIDAGAGQADITLRGFNSTGNARYRLLHATANASLNTLTVEGVKTARQSLIVLSEIRSALSVSRNHIGRAITASVAVSPTININLAENPTYHPACTIAENVVTGGTENSSTGLYVIHGIPDGGLVQGNTADNKGGSTTEGFDIDNLGRFTKVIGNTALGCVFEYKTGTRGYSDSRDCVFAFNVCKGSFFSFRSSVMGYGNVVYNPVGYGIFMGGLSDSDGLLDSGHISLSGFRVLWAGNAWTAGISIGGGAASCDLSEISLEIDPVYAAANPSAKMSGNVIDVNGDCHNLTIRDCFIDKAINDQINVRPDTTLNNLEIRNVRFGEAGDSCIDLANCNGVRIINPVFPAAIADRPLRLTACNRVRIECDHHTLVTLAQTSGGNTGVLINGWGQQAAGTGVPPSADDRWPVGAMVTNISDDTVWLRDSTSTTASSAWKQIA